MAGDHTLEPMLDMFLFETDQLLEQLEQIIIHSEQSDTYSATDINEIFRIMHTIKGAAAMMLYDNIAALSHAIEDVFFYLRDTNPENMDCTKLSDLILSSIDFIKTELKKIREGDRVDGDAAALNSSIKNYLEILKQSNPAPLENSGTGVISVTNQQYYIAQDKKAASTQNKCFKAAVFFDAGCEMENIRAYTVIHELKDFAEDIHYIPENIMEDDSTCEMIRQNGFVVRFSSDRPLAELHDFFGKTILMKEFQLEETDPPASGEKKARPQQIVLEDPVVKIPPSPEEGLPAKNSEIHSSNQQSMISVNVAKLDRLMDLVGELVISEALVVQNPDLRGLTLDNFNKAARQQEKIISELQDMVMSVRMLPLTTTFHKMQRIIRDMCKKLGKDVQLELIGETTEVDKNIIEHISDPLMHLIRNAIDHGIETAEEREAAGKTASGKITLEAKNSGSDVIILITDDGRGLNKGKILDRARQKGLLHKPENELTDKEIYNFIFAPGFSTQDKVTEFSGRGVGMDVVTKNVNSVGGLVLIDSVAGEGTTISLKIPLTLSIIDGMTIRVGNVRYTVPITTIRESFKPQAKEIINDPDRNEMIMVRGQCYPILRIHRLFKVTTSVTDFTDGIIIMVENEDEVLCLFADELLGQQQVVVKALPPYIKNIRQAEGLAGCTLLGDGSISLILDIGGMMRRGYSL
ncbi:MAG TPA: chemotaxis protein CheA [Patescibacteria group bacterium]|nr:chemotaxis protein CheA [Patescibacteria group bacterium]